MGRRTILDYYFPMNITTTTEEAFLNALEALSDSPIWKLLGRAEESALKNPPIFGRTWGNPDGHEGINRRLIRVRSISDRFSKRFIERRMGLKTP